MRLRAVHFQGTLKPGKWAAADLPCLRAVHFQGTLKHYHGNSGITDRFESSAFSGDS